MINNLCLIIGAQRCGTTLLASLLESHNEVCLAKPISPEPKFFIDEGLYSKGKIHYVTKYYSNFKDKLLVEKSTSYFDFPIEVTQRVKTFFSKTKYICILRNPVDRAISNYFFSFANGIETRSVEEVFIHSKIRPVSKVKTSVSPYDYIERGKYVSYIKQWQRLLPKRDFLVIIHEKLLNNPEGELEKLANFLSISNKWNLELMQKKFNATEQSSIDFQVRKKLENEFKLTNIELESLVGYNITEWDYS